MCACLLDQSYYIFSLHTLTVLSHCRLYHHFTKESSMLPYYADYILFFIICFTLLLFLCYHIASLTCHIITYSYIRNLTVCSQCSCKLNESAWRQKISSIVYATFITSSSSSSDHIYQDNSAIVINSYNSLKLCYMVNH